MKNSMKLIKLNILFIIFLSCHALPASISDSEISTYNSEKLKWEDGAYGHHVMFKSLLESDTETGLTCVDETVGTTYTLDSTHIPQDALVEKVFLIWSGAQSVEKINEPADNKVTLNFKSPDGLIEETSEISASEYLVSEPQGFIFDAFTDDEQGAFFTYRKDVTDFFKNIHEKGRELGYENDGQALYGNYTVSDLTCVDDIYYADRSAIMSGWSIIIIYVSQEISPKKIFVYDEFVPRLHDQTEMHVTGFEFPTDPKIKMTFATHEGDPNLFNFENPNGSEVYPEGIQIRGEWVEWLLLSNECNPKVEKTEEDQSFIYSETFNTISSTYGWADEEPTCIGGTPPVWDYESIERAIDVDTFLLDSYKDGSFANHFHKGGQFIELRIGANQDQFFTNYMIVETDTKAPTFDIPGKAELVACTPANEDGKWCENGEHTFAIRIQNWGNDITPPVTVKASIPVWMEYVPGSTEYSTDFVSIDNEMIAKNWQKIPDLENWEFPLKEGFKVADTIPYCGWEDDYLSCGNLIMVRFRATVKADITKHEVIEASASIETSGYPDYKTNLGIPLKLHLESSYCVDNYDINLSKCGGYQGPETCKTDADCDYDEYCNIEEGESYGYCEPEPPPPPSCELDYEIMNHDLYPLDDVVFIDKYELFVLGHINIEPSHSSNCDYELSKIKINYEKNDENLYISNLYLVQNNDSDEISDYEIQLGEIAKRTETYLDLEIGVRYVADDSNSFLIYAFLNYSSNTIQNDASFTPSIEVDGIEIDDTGSGEITGLPITFNKFQLIPDDALSIIRGENDPTFKDEPLVSENVGMLQIKGISKGSDEKITRIKVQIPEEKMVRFGEKIPRIALYSDTDNDGEKDELIAEKIIEEETGQVELNVNIELKEGTYQHYILSADVELEEYDYFSFEIYEIETKNETPVLGVPIISNQYGEPYDPCDEDDQGIGMDSENGCGCSII